MGLPVSRGLGQGAARPASLLQVSIKRGVWLPAHGLALWVWRTPCPCAAGPHRGAHAFLLFSRLRASGALASSPRTVCWPARAWAGARRAEARGLLDGRPDAVPPSRPQDVARLIVERSTVMSHLFSKRSRSPESDAVLLALLSIFSRYVQRMRTSKEGEEVYSWVRRAPPTARPRPQPRPTAAPPTAPPQRRLGPSPPLPLLQSESQDQVFLRWSSGETATMHILVVHAMVILLTLGPPRGEWPAAVGAGRWTPLGGDAAPSDPQTPCCPGPHAAHHGGMPGAAPEASCACSCSCRPSRRDSRCLEVEVSAWSCLVEGTGGPRLGCVCSLGVVFSLMADRGGLLHP